MIPISVRFLLGHRKGEEILRGVGLDTPLNQLRQVSQCSGMCSLILYIPFSLGISEENTAKKFI